MTTEHKHGLHRVTAMRRDGDDLVVDIEATVTKRVRCAPAAEPPTPADIDDMLAKWDGLSHIDLIAQTADGPLPVAHPRCPADDETVKHWRQEELAGAADSMRKAADILDGTLPASVLTREAPELDVAAGPDLRVVG